MGVHTVLLRADEQHARQSMANQHNRSKKAKSTVVACVVCALVSFILGLSLGHGWRNASCTAPAAISATQKTGSASIGAASNLTAVATTSPPTATPVVVMCATPAPTPAPETTPPPTPSVTPSVTVTATPTVTPTATSAPPAVEPLKCPTTVAPAPLVVLPPKSGRPVFMFLGDSITQYASDPGSQGFAARLQNAYVRAADVLNRGVTVYNTKAFVSTALPILEKELSTWLSPAVITVWFGVNDATVVGGNYQSQHVPVENYKQNLITMLTRLRKAAPQAKLLLLTPATVDNGARLGRTNEETAKYAAACREVMNHVEGVTLLDMYKYLMDMYPNPVQRAQLQLDGLHFNANGHGVVFEQLRRQIETLLPGFSSGSVQVPDWDKLHDTYPQNAPSVNL